MEHLKLSLMSNDEDLGEVDVKRVIFKGDSLLPQLFVLSMVPLFHLLLINDLKLFFKNKEQILILVRTVHVFHTDIGMTFGMKKMWNSYHEERSN